MTNSLESINQVTSPGIPDSGPLCVALAHNEAARLADFLRHHKQLGVAHFLIVDDRSTDGTPEMLAERHDVTLFTPNGTEYKTHKAVWRQDLLDRFADGRWVLLPDIDELFVFPFCDESMLQDFCYQLDQENAEAVFAPMVEMYADAPLNEPLYCPGDSLISAYPWFDSTGYRLVPPARRRLRRFLTPPLHLYGGPRERLFYDFDPKDLSAPRRWALARFAHLERSMAPGFLERVGNRAAWWALRGRAPRPPLLMSKVPLIKWRRGLRFPGGPHAVSERLRLSRNWGALLHFKFMDLPTEATYKSQRAQHAKGGEYYESILAAGGFDRSPMYVGSHSYESWRDLARCGLLTFDELV